MFSLLVGLAAAARVWRRQQSAAWPEPWLHLLVVGLALIVVAKAGLNYVQAFTVAGKLSPPYLVAGFSNIRVLGYVSTLWLPLLAWSMVTAHGAGRSARAVGFVALAALWLWVLATGTRAAWLGMAAAMLAFYLWGGLARRWAQWQLAAVVVAVLAYFLLFVALPAAYGVEVVSVLGQRVFDSADASRVLSGRDALYQLSFRLIGEHPWLGVGPMHFARYPEAIAGNPHNAILHIAVEWGLPMLVLWLVLAALYARRMWQFGRVVVHEADSALTPRQAMWVCMQGAVLATAVQSMFSSILADPNSLLWLALVLGWSLGLVASPQPVGVAKSRPILAVVFRWAVFVGAMACIAMLTHVVARDLPRLAAREQVYLQKYGLPLKPRFWRQGMIHP